MRRKVATVLVALGVHLLWLCGAQAYPDRPIAGGRGTGRVAADADGAACLRQDVDVLGQPHRGELSRGRRHHRSQIGPRRRAGRLHASMGSTSTLLIAPNVYKNVGYDAGTFAPVARVADSSEVLAVHPSVVQIRRRTGQSGKGASGRVELRLRRQWHVAAYRGRTACCKRQHPDEPRSLSRRW